MREPAQDRPEVPAEEMRAASPTEARAKRSLILGLALAGFVLVSTSALLVVLAIDARRSGSVSLISVLRDMAIVLVALETLIVGVLLIVLVLQVQALVGLLRDEIRPMLEAINETLATVRGTTRFMSQKVVSPTIQAAGFFAGLRRVVQEMTTLRRGSDEE